ncbi:MAG: hypothetical protein GXO87_06660 [Chlorobi bacterium]|nr:hypothetical protein [Chlorobiota bacterium]
MIDEPDIKRATINWRIYKLTQKSVITRIGRGKYTLKKKLPYKPEISHKIKLLNNKLKKAFPFLTVCIWDASILNEFTMHQANKTFLLIEVEKEALQSVFYFLSEKGHKVFLNPSTDIIEKYISNENNYLIVKTLISEAPIQQVKNVNTVTLEKLMVDIFCDKAIFLPYQGSEMKRIFSSAFNKYLINESKLLRYANRRGKREEIENYIKQINGKK